MIDFTGATTTNTPAQILYQTWRRALEDLVGPYAKSGQAAMFWGLQKGYGIGYLDEEVNGHPVIGFGQVWGKTVYAPFRVTVDGQFSLGHLWGGQQRAILARHTFLDWSWQWSRYHWFYAPWDGGNFNYRDGVLQNHQQPRRYVPERLMLWWYPFQSNGWMKLAETTADHTGWEIVHAADAIDTQGTPARTKADFDRAALTRERRYKRIQKQFEINNGTRDATGKLKVKPQEEQPDAVQQLSAHLKVSKSGRTTPIRKSEEEGLWPRNGCP